MTDNNDNEKTKNVLIGQHISNYSTPLFNAVIFNDSSPYRQMVKKLYNIDTDYFEKIPAWTEQLPSELDFQLKENILNDFKKLADELLNQEMKTKCIGDLLEARETTVDSEKEIVEGTMASIKQFATLYFGRENPCPKVDEKTLQKKYKKAKRRNIFERIGQTNNADVIDFHHTLMYKTVWECKGLIERRVICFIEEILRESIANNNH